MLCYITWALLSPCPVAVSQLGWAVLCLGREQGCCLLCSALPGDGVGVGEWGEPWFFFFPICFCIFRDQTNLEQEGKVLTPSWAEQELAVVPLLPLLSVSDPRITEAGKAL